MFRGGQSAHEIVAVGIEEMLHLARVGAQCLDFDSEELVVELQCDIGIVESRRVPRPKDIELVERRYERVLPLGGHDYLSESRPRFVPPFSCRLHPRAQRLVIGVTGEPIAAEGHDLVGLQLNQSFVDA
jgi:hypothetical protein